MHGIERRKDPQLLERGHLVVAQELPVNEDGAAIGAGYGGLRGTHGGDELIDGRIAVGMRQHLPVVLIGQRVPLQRLGIGKRRIPGIRCLLAGRGLEVGLGKPRRLALRRPIKRELHAPEAHMVGVAAGHQRTMQDGIIPHRHDVRIRHDIDLECARRRKLR